jgi:hypothetical protein
LQFDEAIPVKSEKSLYEAVVFENLELVHGILAAGADPDLPRGALGTPLCEAVNRNNGPIVELLLRYGADPLDSHPGNRNGSPMKNARFRQNPEIISLFQSFKSFSIARSLHNSMFRIVLDNPHKPEVRPYIHAELIFIFSITFNTAKLQIMQDHIPWAALATYLNNLIDVLRAPPVLKQNRVPNIKGVAQTYKAETSVAEMRRIQLPLTESEETEMPNATGHVPYRPFTEDYILRGLIYTELFYPDQYFEKANLDIDERALSQPSDEEDRVVRILWVGRQVAKRLRAGKRLLEYDYAASRFSSIKS